ncbi:MAG: acyl-CoA thioesterase [Bacteroidota bacterium]|nr:acyl-CoA thioesterase [Bacteroidota bacterium]
MPLTIPIEIRFADIDKLGHVNNAVYLTYFEQARLKYFKEVIGTGIDWSENGIILAKAEIDFILPLLLENKAVVEISCSRIGTKSFDLNYQIIVEKSNTKTVITKGKTIMVCYNYKNEKTIEIPTNWLEKVKSFEPGII